MGGGGSKPVEINDAGTPPIMPIGGMIEKTVVITIIPVETAQMINCLDQFSNNDKNF